MKKTSRRHRILGAWAMRVSHHPRQVLAVAGLMVILSLAVTLLPIRLPGMARPLGPLGFQANRNDLISARLDWNQRFIRWQKQFSGTSDYIFVADAGPEGPDRAIRTQAIRTLIDELGPALSRDEWVRQAVWGFDKRKVSPKAIRLATLDETQPSDEFRRSLEQVVQSRTLLASANPADFISRIVAQMRQQEQQSGDEEEAIAGLNGLADLLQALAISWDAPLDGQAQSPNAAADDWLVRQLNDAADYGDQPWQYLVSENGRLYFVRITPRPAPDQLNAFEPSIASIRRIMVQVALKHPTLKLDVDFGLTGIDVVETDETEAVTWDGTWTSILAAILILSVLVVSYHSWRTPGMMMAALAAAIAWTFGFTTLAVGHLQVISVIFVPLLLGLGIAYGIYLAARFEIVRHDYPDTPDGFALAMRDTFQTMGPGILTGMVTTAAAFMTTVWTDFTGVAEMGLIAGVGVVFCLLAMVTVFPALVRILKPSHRHIRAVETRRIKPYDDRWFMPFARHPKVTLAIGGVLTLLALASLVGMKFNYNLLELQPRGLSSVDWERRVVQDGGESIWFGVSVAANLNEARQLAERYRQQPDVGVVRGVALLFPEDEERKVRRIRQAAAELESSLNQARQVASVPASALAMQVNWLKLGFDRESNRKDIPPQVRPAMDRVGQTLGRLQSAIQSAGPSSTDRLTRLEKQFSFWRQTSETLVRQALDPTPLGLSDLPKEILDAYIAADGSLAVEVFPRLAQGDVLSPTFLPGFISQLKSVDPGVTGVVVQVYESGRLIQHAYVTAGLWGLIVVFLLVLIDFKNWRDALLSLMPVVIGFVITFAIMRCCGMTINPANIIVLPLMFGIGVDSGVNMLHRYRMNPGDQPPGLTQGTGKGIVVVNATTLIGFGVLIGAAHRGIQSLGFVLTAGMAMTVLTCLTVMPAWLELRRRRSSTR